MESTSFWTGHKGRQKETWDGQDKLETFTDF